jgi:hypothetical protein
MINSYEDLILRKDNSKGVLSKEFFMNYVVDLPGNLNDINKRMLEIEKEQIDDEGGFEEEV